MHEKEPSYITDLKRHIVDTMVNTIENHEPKYFRDFKVHIDKKIENKVNGLALIIKDTVATKQDIEDIRKEMATKDDIRELWEEVGDMKNNMATKSDVIKILAHIGKYEVRAQNHEETLHEDHKPRIVDLEKKVFA